MNASISCISVICFTEDDSSSFMQSVSTMAASQSSDMHNSIIAEGYCIAEEDKGESIVEEESAKEDNIPATSMTEDKNKLAIRKRAMFRRALSCENLGCPSSAGATKATRRPRRRRTKPRRSQSTPNNGVVIVGAAHLTEPTAALVEGRWGSSTVESTPPIKRVSRRCSVEHDISPEHDDNQACISVVIPLDVTLSGISRWNTDDTPVLIRRGSKGPPQRTPSDACHDFLILEEDTNVFQVVEDCSELMKDQQVRQPKAVRATESSKRLPVRSVSSIMSPKSPRVSSSKSPNTRTRGRWHARRSVTMDTLPGSRGCPPPRHLSPVRLTA